MSLERRRYHPIDAGERQWHMLLAFALERADEFECALPYRVVVQDLARLRLKPESLEQFRPALVDRHVSLIRWETRQDYATQFVRLRMSAALAGWVAAVRWLEHWSWRNDMPEDPTFYQAGQVLLATESRHGRIAVFADPVDRAALDGVGIRLLEPLGVRAEPWPTP
jgi:hypothetical protein